MKRTNEEIEVMTEYSLKWNKYLSTLFPRPTNYKIFCDFEFDRFVGLTASLFLKDPFFVKSDKASEGVLPYKSYLDKKFISSLRTIQSNLISDLKEWDYHSIDLDHNGAYLHLYSPGGNNAFIEETTTLLSRIELLISSSEEKDSFKSYQDT